MKLPHGELLLFAKEVTNKTEDSIEVHCVFPMLPSLAMFIEAAAQCSAGFDVGDNIELGFLTMVKNIQLQVPITIKESEYLFTLHQEALVGEYSQYSFEAVALKSKVKTVTGSFTVMIKKKELE